MASIIVAIEKTQVPAFKEMLDSTDLVDIVREEPSSYQRTPTVHFTLDAGVGNAINYFYLGQAWSDALHPQKPARP
jgi:xanthine dehydrogenase molybdopterin-binding subunit B